MVRALARLAFPLLATVVAAALGYAYAVLPVWAHTQERRRAETFGSLYRDDRVQREAAAAYSYDADVVDRFDELSWSPPTVMTPFVGHAPRPGQHHNARIDARQFRGAATLDDPKPDGRFRIVVTGASVAYGAGAPSDERTIGGVLQAILDERSRPGRRYEVFTFAAPGWSSTHERIAIANRLTELEPDLVVAITGVADIFYAEQGKNILWSRAFTDEYYWRIANAAFTRAGLPPMTDVALRGARRVSPDLVGQRIAKNARLAAFALAEVGAGYHLFLQPAVATTAKPLSPREQLLRRRGPGVADPDYFRRCAEAIDRSLTEAAELPAIAYTDMTGVFDALSARRPVFTDSFHVGDRGNDLMARFVAERIESGL